MGVVFHFYNSDDDDDDEDDARSPSKSTRKTVKQLEVYVCLFVVVHFISTCMNVSGDVSISWNACCAARSWSG